MFPDLSMVNETLYPSAMIFEMGQNNFRDVIMFGTAIVKSAYV